MQNNNLYELKVVLKKLVKDKRQNRITKFSSKSSEHSPQLSFFVPIKPIYLISKTLYLIKIICSKIPRYKISLINTENKFNEIIISVGGQL